MGPGTLCSLFFCHLILLASGNPAEAGEESVPEEGPGHLSFLNAEYNLLRNQLCNPKWTSHGFYCYRYFDTPRTFYDAEEECQSHGPGVHLASVSSAFDSAFLAGLVETAQYNVWIGLRNVVGCNTWTWTDGTPYNPSYTPWAFRQPNNCMAEQVCVQLSQCSKFQKWDDGACHSRTGYVCETLAKFVNSA